MFLCLQWKLCFLLPPLRFDVTLRNDYTGKKAFKEAPLIFRSVQLTAGTSCLEQHAAAIAHALRSACRPQQRYK